MEFCWGCCQVLDFVWGSENVVAGWVVLVVAVSEWC